MTSMIIRNKNLNKTKASSYGNVSEFIEKHYLLNIKKIPKVFFKKCNREVNKMNLPKNIIKGAIQQIALKHGYYTKIVKI